MSMSTLGILKLPDRTLRKKAAYVNRVSDAEREILRDMAEAMYLNKGVGLAALQVGIDKQLAVIDVGEGLVKLINPAIIKREGSAVEEEGCLSVPGLQVRVRRAKRVTVTFLDEKGEVSRLSADGLASRALQHEIDHLSGRLIVDYLNPIKRLLAIRGLRPRLAG